MAELKVELIRDNHLGGFVKGGDPRTYYPEMWRELVKMTNAKSVVDVGCGEGHSSKFFQELGLNVLAIDGSEKVRETAVFQPIVIHDYAVNQYVPELIFDLAWCCEFVEHVDEKFIDHFMATLSRGKTIAMTHALPGQHGYHHVNEQTDYYWIKKVEAWGYTYDDATTAHLRKLSHDYFKISGLIFKSI